MRERWITPEGRQRLARVLRALRRKEKHWEKYLEGFPGVDEVENRRDLRGVILAKARLLNVSLDNANFSGADLSVANLSGADLNAAELSKVVFTKTKINHHTKLAAIRFSPEHPVSYDGSDTIRMSFLDRLVNWAKLRKIGQFPLFGVSWAAFALSLTVVNFLGAINAGLVRFGWATVPIPMPLRMELILLDSILLVLGTTLYKLFCPDTIQEFSETQWVSQHHQPRLIYYREMWRKWWLVWWTGFLSISGAAIALYLIGERAVMAAKYLLRFGF